MRNAIAAGPLASSEPEQSVFQPVLSNRLTCTVREACGATGIGKTKMHELISGGAVRSTKVGRRRLVIVPSLLRLVGQETDPGIAQPTC